MSPGQLPTPRQGTALVFLVLLLLVTAGVTAQGWSVYPGLLFTEVVLLLLPTLAACRRLELPPGFVLGLRDPAPGRPLAALATGAGIGVLSFAMAMGLTWPAIMLLLLMGGRHPGLPLPLAGPVDLLWALAIGAVLAPVCEELLFRGFLQSSLRSYGLHAMVWTAAVCFGLFHLDPLRFIPTTALGVVYGYLAASYRSIYPSMAAHGTNNFIALVLGYLGGAGGARPELTYEVMEKEMVRQFSETGVPLSGLGPEQMVFLGVLASMVVMLAGGVALAILVALILRGLARRAAASVADAGEEPAAVSKAVTGPGEEPAGAGTAIPEPGKERRPTRPAVELLRNPWVGGIASIAVLFWGLAIWSYFRAAPGEPDPPDPPAIRTDGGGASLQVAGRGCGRGGGEGRGAFSATVCHGATGAGQDGPTEARGDGVWAGQRGRAENIAPEPKLLGIVRGEVTESWSLSVTSVPASESVSLSPFYTR